MRRRPLPQANEIGVNVTPLIDIVMCLIIFFMLVAKIGVDTGGDREITVPASFLGVDLKDLGNTLTLNVAKGPNIAGGVAQPLITCLQRGQREEIKIRSDAGGQADYPLYDLLKHFKDG